MMQTLSNTFAGLGGGLWWRGRGEARKQIYSSLPAARLLCSARGWIWSFPLSREHQNITAGASPALCTTIFICSFWLLFIDLFSLVFRIFCKVSCKWGFTVHPLYFTLESAVSVWTGQPLSSKSRVPDRMFYSQLRPAPASTTIKYMGWLPLPLSFIKLKAVKRNGES